MLQTKLKSHGPLNNNLQHHLQAWPLAPMKFTLHFVQNLSPSILIWEIWKERNGRIFQEKLETLERLLLRINQAIQEITSATVSKFVTSITPFTHTDQRLQLAQQRIFIRPMNGFGEVDLTFVPRELVVQEKPHDGWWKCNFYGALKGNPGPSGACFIIRDANGDLISLGGKRLQDETNNNAKVEAALLATRAYKKLGLNSMWKGIPL